MNYLYEFPRELLVVMCSYLEYTDISNVVYLRRVNWAEIAWMKWGNFDEVNIKDYKNVNTCISSFMLESYMLRLMDGDKGTTIDWEGFFYKGNGQNIVINSYKSDNIWQVKHMLEELKVPTTFAYSHLRDLVTLSISVKPKTLVNNMLYFIFKQSKYYSKPTINF
jgi:hypothetical protein